MHIEVFRPAELTSEHWTLWSRLQLENPLLRSPYFRPEFTEAVAAVRSDVEVAVLMDATQIRGFFPYQRRGNVALPVGGRLSDYQGVIVPEECEFDPRALLAGCRLQGWSFDHLIAAQKPLVPYHFRRAQSPYLDLSAGFEAYLLAQKKTHPQGFRRVLQRSRKLEREVGPLRLVYDPPGHKYLDILLAWKTRQFRERGVANVFAVPWTRDLLTQVLRRRSAHFAGVMVGLYAAEQLVALQLGMTSRDTFHVWFIAYNPALSQLGNFSPGLTLLVELARTAPSLGLRTIDLGKGTEAFKSKFMSAAVALAEGFVDQRLIHRAWKRAYWKTRNMVRSSPLRLPAKKLASYIAPWYSARLFS